MEWKIYFDSGMIYILWLVYSNISTNYNILHSKVRKRTFTDLR